MFVEFWHNLYIRRSPGPPRSLLDVYPYLAGDYYFFGTSVAFDLYATGWKYYFLNHNEQGRHGGHNFHADTIVRNNLDLVPVNIPHRFQFSKLHKSH